MSFLAGISGACFRNWTTTTAAATVDSGSVSGMSSFELMEIFVVSVSDDSRQALPPSFHLHIDDIDDIDGR